MDWSVSVRSVVVTVYRSGLYRLPNGCSVPTFPRARTVKGGPHAWRSGKPDT